MQDTFEKCPQCGGDLEVKRRINWFFIGLALVIPPIGVFILAANGLTRKVIRCTNCPWGYGS
jgi:hypothetical protein